LAWKASHARLGGPAEGQINPLPTEVVAAGLAQVVLQTAAKETPALVGRPSHPAWPSRRTSLICLLQSRIAIAKGL